MSAENKKLLPGLIHRLANGKAQDLIEFMDSRFVATALAGSV